MSVICTGELSGKRIRFVRPPGDGPKFPYVVESDLAKALNMTHAQRRAMVAYPGKSMVAMIDGREERCLPCDAAQGLVDAVEITRLLAAGEFEAAAAIEKDIVAAPLTKAYVKEASAALSALTAGMSAEELLNYVFAAAKAE